MRIEESVAFEASPDTVWPWISAPERLSKWITDVERFEVSPAGELAVGSLLIAHLPKTGESIPARVEAIDPGRRLSLRASKLPNNVEVVLDFDLRQQDGGSLLVLSADAKLPGLLAFAGKMVASKARQKIAVWTGELRARLAASG
jgi:carbon monoxide dehydrogenase subunit G